MPSFALVAVALAACSASSSSNGSAASEDAGDVDGTADTSTALDTGSVDTGEPTGRVLVLRIYDPKARCYEAPTEIGSYDLLDDGGLASCGSTEVCYRRTDGVLAYHTMDCIQARDGGAGFRANWERLDYSDLGPCEPLKHTDFGFIKDCPQSTCAFARDLTIDTAAMCATAITTRGCLAAKPTSCACDGTGKVFLAADATSTVPAGFAACDASDPACKKALDGFDTVVGCAD